jgi:hypothetical protein
VNIVGAASDPDVPVMVTVYVPAGVDAVVLTVRVEVVSGAIELGLSEQVGAGVSLPLTAHARFTAALKPLVALRLIVEVADPPGVLMVADVGFAVSVKLGTALTVKVTVTVWLVDPDVPVMVTVEVPPGVAVVVEMVSVEVAGDAPGVTEAGANAQLPPVGRPTEHDSATAALKPFSALTEMV